MNVLTKNYKINGTITETQMIKTSVAHQMKKKSVNSILVNVMKVMIMGTKQRDIIIIIGMIMATNQMIFRLLCNKTLQMEVSMPLEAPVIAVKLLVTI